MDQLKDRQPAKIVFRSQPSVPFEGVVARLGKQSDRDGATRDLARQHGAVVIVVAHDHRTLDVFDTICKMEDGVIEVAGKATVH